MKQNIFEVKHLKFDTEEFQITSAQYNLYQVDNSIWELTFYFEADKPLKRAKKLEEIIDAKPNFEVTVVLTSDDLKLETGKVFYQKESYDYQKEENLSNIYYFEHESINDVEIKLVEVEEKWIIASIKGKTIIDDYSKKEPDAVLLVHNTKFYLDENLTRGIS